MLAHTQHRETKDEYIYNVEKGCSLLEIGVVVGGVMILI